MSNQLYVAENITKKYTGRINSFSLDNISVELKAGEITGVVGENGNGKTTLLRIIAGELSISEGLIQYPQMNVELPKWKPIKEKIAYIPQRVPRWFGVLKDNLHLKATAHGIIGKENENLVANLLEELGLSEFANHKWSEISTGYRLRFQLAKMLVGSPQLIILDEPIANLDINAQQKFLSDLQKIVNQKDRQISIILSSQQLHEIEDVSQNINFLKKGKLLYGGSVNDYGKERQENTFEISLDVTSSEIKNLLEGIPTKNIAELSGKFIIETETSVNSSQLLKHFLDQGKTIHYFRDIITSTKKLFNQ